MKKSVAKYMELHRALVIADANDLFWECPICGKQQTKFDGDLQCCADCDEAVIVE